MKPPQPSANPRDPLSIFLRHRRAQTNNVSTKTRQPSVDALNSSAKQNISLTDDSELDGLIDRDDVSDILSTTKNPFDSTLLSVKSIIPLAGPQHANHHLLQHH